MMRRRFVSPACLRWRPAAIRNWLKDSHCFMRRRRYSIGRFRKRNRQHTNTMAQQVFHPSIEGAQHGAKSLADFLDYAKNSGATGAQPSNFMLQDGKRFKSAQEIKD